VSRIFFYTAWDGVETDPKAGGPKVVQQHVRILREQSRDARIVLGGRGRWFGRLDDHERELAVRRHDFEKDVGADDVVVVPAIHSGRMDAIPGSRKVLMVQNGGLLFDSLPLDPPEALPWHHPDLEAIVCVSEHDRRLLELTEPACPVHRVFNAVVESRFEPVAWSDRENLILASPLNDYKNPWHTKAVCHAVVSRARARLDGDDRAGTSRSPGVPSVRVIQGLPPEAVEDLLPRARVLVFLSVVEGFGLLPLEAIMAGTPVVGYRGQAYAEFMPERYLHDASDFESMVGTIEEILRLDADDPWHEVREEARREGRRYSARRQEASLSDVWAEILGGTP